MRAPPRGLDAGNVAEKQPILLACRQGPLSVGRVAPFPVGRLHNGADRRRSDNCARCCIVCSAN